MHYLTTSDAKLPAWHKARPIDIENYRVSVANKIADLENRSISNFFELEEVNKEFVNILNSTALLFIPHSGFNSMTKPGWNDDVKDLHKLERRMRGIWLSEGRPRVMHFVSYFNYKRAKRNFRNALNIAYENHMRDVYRDIDEAAKCDVRLFWRLVKGRKPRTSRTYPEVIDKIGKSCTDPENVAEAFALHFENIYTPSGDDMFDDNFETCIEEKFQDILHNISEHNKGSIPGGDITADEILTVIRGLKLRKAPGEDRVTNEHIKYGGDDVSKFLVKLFNTIFAIENVPSAWKRGLIVPLYKGGNKPKTSSASYRPVALLSSVFKVFERILQNRISNVVLSKVSFPNSQQQGFQPLLGCTTASFTLLEIIFHYSELGSNVYVSFLATSQAFDTVWRHGLLVKLHDLGIFGKLWTLINDCHSETLSAIIVSKKQSRWFPVLQGVRQGGVLSSFLYLTCIDELLYSLERASINTGILNVTSNCPTLADDLSCIGVTPQGLQNMLSIAYEYSIKWHFRFNASKSCILILRAQGNKVKNDHAWYLGDSLIKCENSCTHLGVIINDKNRKTNLINSACDKGRKAYFALRDIGSEYLNPKSMVHLYRTIVLPSVFYGCEIWGQINNTDMQRLNVFQHFVCKNIMGLPRYSRSDIAESLLGLLPIRSEIVIRKLLFLGRLCRLNYRMLPKQVFMTRLFSYLEDLSGKQIGFIPDILSLLQEFDLFDVFNEWIIHGSFPSKLIWKRIVRNAVNDLFTQSRITRMSHDTDFSRFRTIFPDNAVRLWSLPTNCYEISLCKYIAKICAEPPSQITQIRVICQTTFCDVFIHASCVCPITTNLRHQWWDYVFEHFNIQLSADLCALDESDLFHVLLGQNIANLDTDDVRYFRLSCYSLVRDCAAHYNQILRKFVS
ncbi:hypothetical protein FSP39_024486 [Pinctada imbricata]|uniref:Reverse transcriptase domain-containing protein n=1 Tax=Pinctada imbricata TaxID=66713 RepID=A0AA88YHW8_PINIB|nr:hypothetical protein FSP39_024486 [Pinctada imbricata]